MMEITKQLIWNNSIAEKKYGLKKCTMEYIISPNEKKPVKTQVSITWKDGTQSIYDRSTYSIKRDKKGDYFLLNPHHFFKKIKVYI